MVVCVCVQVVEDGYEFFAKRQLVTLFSAPNYCGEFDNAGAMMSVDETLMCSFQVRNCMTSKVSYQIVCRNKPHSVETALAQSVETALDSGRNHWKRLLLQSKPIQLPVLTLYWL